MVFNNKTTPHKVLMDRTARLVVECGVWSMESMRVIFTRSCYSPRSGVYQLNVDALMMVDGRVGLSVVSRNSDGVVLFAASCRFPTHWIPKLAETKAITMAVRLC